jgi:NAD dependent epimerase/dehydratase family enzyme
VRPGRYNRSVADAESAADSFTRRGGIGVVVRFGMFYGADSDFTRQIVDSVRKGWAPSLGPPEGFISSLSHDDAATAVVAALDVPAGIYNAVDDEPVSRRDYHDSLADALGVAHPRFPPAWLSHLAGSLGETLARSLRISNRKLRSVSSWAPAYRSVREGWPPVVAELIANPDR